MSEPLSQGFDQTCGTCQGSRILATQSSYLGPDGKTIQNVILHKTCTTCNGAGRIGGQSR